MNVNKPGGGGGPFPGAVEVAKAPTEGYTIGSFIIAAGKDAPYSDMAELAKHAKSNDVVLGHFGDPLVPTRVTKALALFGVYSLGKSITDCVISAVFGIFGLVLKRLNLPIVPIILGMVLGNIIEVKLRSSMPLLKTPLDMIDRPISFILFCMIVLILALHVQALINEYKNQQPDVDHNLHNSQQG